MPQYSKTVWVNDNPPAIDATNLNKIEQGIFDALPKDGSVALSGQLVTTAGTVSAPAISPTGDANTGIFFPAADTIAFGEGGAEAMRINSSGQVGIGLTPDTTLHIGSTATPLKIQASRSDQYGAEMYLYASRGTVASPTTTQNNDYIFSMAGFGRGATAWKYTGNIALRAAETFTDSAAGSYLTFETTLAGTTTSAEKMRITSAGNVAIGTQSPNGNYILNIAGSSAASGTFGGINVANLTGGSTVGSSIKLGYISDFYGARITAYGNSSVAYPADLAFERGNGSTYLESMRITSAGNVGIGTTSPTNKLQIDGVTANTSCINAIANTTTGQSFGIALSAGSNSSDYALNIRNAAQTSQLFHITGAGNVGIGTTSPDVFSRGYSGTILGISSSGQSAIELNSATGNTAYLDFGVAGTRRGNIQVTASDMTIGTNGAYPLYFAANNDIKMTLTSAGNVGIGTTSPSAKLHVSDASASNSNVTIQLTNTQSSKNLVLGSSATAFAYQGIGNNDSFVLSDLSNLTLAAWSSSAIKFVTGTTEKGRFDSNGYLLIGYTSSNGAYPLQVNGQIFATSSTIATSDGKYKKDVVALDGALDIVTKLNPVQFSWKEHPVHKFNTDVPTVGFIAQEVAEVLKDKAYLTSLIKKSECTWETETGETTEREVTKEVTREVVEEVDGEEVTRTITEEVTETVTEPVKETHTEEFLGIAESNMIAILTKAIQELKAEVDALKAQLAK